MTTTKEPGSDLPLQQQESVVIRFAGDSGDGMQITGNQYATTSAVVGNDLATMPDFPAEIRAPAGTRAGVSGFQLAFSSKDIFTPGDRPDVLVAMNPAALVANIKDLKQDGIVVVNTGNFGDRDLEKAKCETNPLLDGTLDGYRVIEVDMNQRVKEALTETELKPKEIQRCKNFYTLGLMYWLFSRPLAPTEEWLKEKFAKKMHFAEANIVAMRAGFNAGDIHELFQGRYEVPKCDVLTPGTYRSVMGNDAVAIGLVAGAQAAELELFLEDSNHTLAERALAYMQETDPLFAAEAFARTLDESEDPTSAMWALYRTSLLHDIGGMLAAGSEEIEQLMLSNDPVIANLATRLMLTARPAESFVPDVISGGTSDALYAVIEATLTVDGNFSDLYVAALEHDLAAIRIAAAIGIWRLGNDFAPTVAEEAS